MDLLNVDITTGRIHRAPVPDSRTPVGGRSLIGRILSSGMDPGIHPLGSENILVIAPGFFAGSAIPNTGRLSIGAKSPLTLGIKESNGGGVIGQSLARHSIQGVVVSGKSATPKLLRIDGQSATLEDASYLHRLGTYRTCELLRSRYGPASVACVGPCGEMGMAASSVALSDMKGAPTRHCGRGGMGAVMGSKEKVLSYPGDAGYC